MTERSTAELADALDARAKSLMKLPKSDDFTVEVSPWVVSELDRAAASRLRELAEALEPFALVAEYDIGDEELDGERFIPMTPKYARAPIIRVGDLRAARRALGGETP